MEQVIPLELDHKLSCKTVLRFLMAIASLPVIYKYVVRTRLILDVQSFNLEIGFNWLCLR